MSTGSNKSQIGKVLLRFENLDSTNDYTHKLIKIFPQFHGICVQADYQYKGRGQQNNQWQVEAGKNLTLSIALQPNELKAKAAFNLTIYVSVVLRNLIQAYCSEVVSIKWPNDIYVGGKKVVGFLVETQLSGQHIHYALIGIGINVNQMYFEGLPNASSIRCYTGEEVPIATLRDELIAKLASQYRYLDSHVTRKVYLDNLYQKNIWRSYRDKDGNLFKGMIVDVNPEGLLCVLNEQGVRKNYFLKEISFV